MKRSHILILICIASMLLTAEAQAAPDQYPGDTSIYGSQVVLEPNVLLLIDTSGSMINSGEDVPGADYSQSTTYTQTTNCGTGWLDNCSTTGVYRVIKDPGEAPVYSYLTDISNVTNNRCPSGSGNPRPKSTLQGSAGQYTGRKLNVDGTCGGSGTATYYYGNYINYLFNPGSTMHKMDVVKSVVDSLVESTSGVRFGVMTFHFDSDDNALGGQLVADVPSGATGTYTTEIKDMDDIFEGTMDNRTALRRVVRAIYPTSTSARTPLAEALYEAGRYFSGSTPGYDSSVPGLYGGTYFSPASPSCRNNYVVFLTDGKSTADKASGTDTLASTLGSLTIPDVLTCTNGDCDGDGAEPVITSSWWGTTYDYSHSLDDVAKYLNLGTQKIKTYTIGFGSEVTSTPEAVDLLTRAANIDHGHGAYFSATSQTALAQVFSSIIANILAVNSSYVAPVVPVSPDNRTYGGSRVFMGFFKPIDNSSTWLGNLKKYGLDSSNNVTDMTGVAATNSSGAFKSTAKSFWSGAVDGADVDSGGAGALLQAKTTITTSRTIYTTASKTDGASLVALNDSSITTGLLNVADSTTRTNLLNYVYGLDAYGSDPTLNRPWVLGDVMHSKPLIINYAKYTFCDSVNHSTDHCGYTDPPLPTFNEQQCGTNRSRIFVGANDGMLHAFKDCDGSELWAFTPYDLLPNLQFIPQTLHSYFVDSTPSVYLYDANNNGTIDTSSDKVILMIGERRGGGSNVGAQGAYHVLDVTNAGNTSGSTAPTFKYTIDNTTTGFSELGETWSEPKIVKMRITLADGTKDRIVAFFGAGYDNLNEDMRYGNTQSFSGATVVDNGNIGHDASVTPDVVSTTGSAVSPKGRGVYAALLATLDSSGAPTITATPTKIWGDTYGASTTTGVNPATNSAMTFSFPGEIAAIDVNGTGYTSRIYTADTGGNIWRFNVGDPVPANWTANRIFSANPTSGTDTGRKIFYKPSVVTQPGYSMLFFGTGDREHPRNVAVTDRIYALKDKGQTTADGINESSLYDATNNDLQEATGTATQIANSIAGIMTTLNGSGNYGWYIKLNETGHDGEKVLAPPLVFNKVAYFTTYAPGVVAADACGTGNLGTARMYAVNYMTGEAVLNYNTGNDSNAGTIINDRALRGGASGSQYVLGKGDREMTTGSGIPSGVVMVINPNGTLKILTGIGGALRNDNPLPGGSIVPLYWRQQ